MISFEAIDALVQHHLQGTALDWWRSTTCADFDRIRFLAALSGAGRRLGQGSVAGLDGDRWSWAALGRVGVLLSLPGRINDGGLVDVVGEAYRTGDLQEKQAVLRALAFLPTAEQFLAIAAEGARSNAVSILEAIACDNPYPTRYFSQDALNQLTMKALFNGLPLARVVGLKARINADLVRMARDYASERRAAGRSISEDLSMLEQESPLP